MKKSTRAFFASTLFAAIFSTATTALAEHGEWSGFYAGLHAGLASNNFNGVFDSAGSEFSLGRVEDEDSVAGLQVGYNFGNVGGERWTFGIEGTFTQSWLSDSKVDNENDTQEIETEYLASIRGKAGVPLNEHTLFYGIFGYGYSETDISIESGRGDTTVYAGGYVFGLGAEYLFSNNLSLRFETLFYDFDENDSLNERSLDDADSGDYVRVENVTSFELGLNYHF